MQEIRYDDTERLTERATTAQVQSALADAANRTVALHRPGAVFDSWENGKRKRFRVTEDGALQRVTLDGRDWPS